MIFFSYWNEIHSFLTFPPQRTLFYISVSILFQELHLDTKSQVSLSSIQFSRILIILIALLWTVSTWPASFLKFSAKPRSSLSRIEEEISMKFYLSAASRRSFLPVAQNHLFLEDAPAGVHWEANCRVSRLIEPGLWGPLQKLTDPAGVR